MSKIVQGAVRHIGSLFPRKTGKRLRSIAGRLDRLEHFTLGSSATYVGNNRVLLRIVAGRHLFMLYVHADDKLISPSLIVNGRYEPELTDFLVRELRPDTHFIDAGTNLGYFTCLMAKHCPEGRVIGLEPNPVVHTLAVDNVLLNALHVQAEVLNVAASDAPGELTLYHRIGRSGNTSVAAVGADFTRVLQEPPEEAFTVPSVRIDDLLERMSGRVDFLKIDVEGAEPLVLAGAKATIAANPQLQIVMEWAPAQIAHAGFPIAEVVRDLAAAGLAVYRLGGATPEPISHDDLVGLPYQVAILLRRRTA